LERRFVRLEYIKKDPLFNYHEYDKVYLAKKSHFFRVYGQLSTLYAVRKSDDDYMLIFDDGSLDIMKDLKFQGAHCIVLDGFENRDLYKIKLFLTEFELKKDNIMFADFINLLVSNAGDARNLSGITMLSEDDIMAYKDLLTFDWNQYEKEEKNQQPTLF
jgi:hypothetical protein